MSTEAAPHLGPERRRHKVFVTRNSEYHCRTGVCVAVRDRRTGQFLPTHKAVGRRISAGVRFSPNGGIASISNPEAPEVGDQLCFAEAPTSEMPQDVVTSPLSRIERPPKEVVGSYPN
jgi:hypothetical protein